jgi:hypothetical protein
MTLPRRDVDDLSARWVAKTYGGLVPAKDLSQLLGFATSAALRRAHATGRLPIPLFRLQGRRGWFAHAGDISSYLRSQGRAAIPEGDNL